MLEDDTCIIGGCSDSTSNGYVSWATYDDGSCPIIFQGCTDSNAVNYRPIANEDDGTCLHAGCLDSAMLNYDPTAGLAAECTPYIDGCMTASAENFVQWANRDDGTCKFIGCTDSGRENYKAKANADDGTCTPLVFGCTDPAGENYKPDYTADDGTCSYGGCTDSTAGAYSSRATFDDLTCVAQNRRSLAGQCLDPAASNYQVKAACDYKILGCMNTNAINYLSSAQQERNPTDCVFPVHGCTLSQDTLNFDSSANMLQGCVYVAKGCTDSTATNYVANANTDDKTCSWSFRTS